MRVDDVGGTSGSTAKSTPTVAPTPRAAPPATPAETAEALVDRSTPIGTTRPDVRQLAGLVSQQAAAAPDQAPAVRRQVEALLTPVEVGQLKRDMATYDATQDIDRDGLVTEQEKAALRMAAGLKLLGIDAPVVNLHLDDPDYKGIPQGQGYDAKTNEFFTTYYAQQPVNGKEGYDVRLSVQDKATGLETSYVKLRTSDNRHLGHGGGVGVTDKWVFVSDGGKVYTYDRAQIDAASGGATILPAATTSTGASSFMNVSPDGKYAYVGEFDKSIWGPGNETEGWPELHRYEIEAISGKLINGSGPEKIPNNAQGVAITKEGLIFTTSYGSSWFSPNEVIYQKFAKDPSEGFALEDRDDAKTIGEIEYYAEGANVIGDDLFVTFESGANPYREKVDDPISTIRKFRLSDFE